MSTRITSLQKLMYASYFSAQKHSEQRRKDIKKTPYINHPIEVSFFLTKHGVVDTDVLCASLLHDTIEDTNTTKEELIEHFGKRVCDIVLECSDDKSLDSVSRKKLQIEHACSASIPARLVKLADKWSNISSLLKSPPSSWTKERIYGYVVWGRSVCTNAINLNDLSDQDKIIFDSIWKDMDELFNKFGVISVIDDELKEYYKLLNLE